jgi:murein DD-endopeptidase MepM/ murein hydrolase activator NlpD
VAQVDGKVKLDPVEVTKVQRQPQVTGRTPLSLAIQRPVIFNYTVRPGDNLSLIAQQFSTDVETLLGLNVNHNLSRLQPGETIKVMNIKGIVHTLATGETLGTISKRYSVSVAKLASANGITDPSLVHVGQQIIVPGVKPRRPADKLSSRGGLLFAWPARGWISSRFGRRWGRMHEGIDLAAVYGSPVVAAAPGRVVYAGWEGGYGKLVTVDHGWGYQTRYGHNARILVRVGQRVERGQVLASAGSTGNSTGTHVHFEIRVNGRAENPVTWLRR